LIFLDGSGVGYTTLIKTILDKIGDKMLLYQPVGMERYFG